MAVELFGLVEFDHPAGDMLANYEERYKIGDLV
jgi:hypothetical protein